MRRVIVAITGAFGATYGIHSLDPDDVHTLVDHLHHPRDVGAAVSSDSFVSAGMLVAPHSMKTLVVRAADVCLKERRRVVLTLREKPFHADHIDLMARAITNGAIVMPPVPACYALPTTIDET